MLKTDFEDKDDDNVTKDLLDIDDDFNDGDDCGVLVVVSCG